MIAITVANAVLVSQISSVVLGLAALVIGALGCLIAYRQHLTADAQRRNAEAKLRLELYEKRYAVYRAVIALLDRASRDNGLESVHITEFHAATAERGFLFGKDVLDHVDQLGRTVMERRILLKRISHPSIGSSDERDKVVREETAKLEWIVAQYKETAMIFAPYLDFKSIRA